MFTKKFSLDIFPFYYKDLPSDNEKGSKQTMGVLEIFEVLTVSIVFFRTFCGRSIAGRKGEPQNLFVLRSVPFANSAPYHRPRLHLRPLDCAQG